LAKVIFANVRLAIHKHSSLSGHAIIAEKRFHNVNIKCKYYETFLFSLADVPERFVSTLQALSISKSLTLKKPGMVKF
jgi:hypothetical protein